MWELPFFSVYYTTHPIWNESPKVRIFFSFFCTAAFFHILLQRLFRQKGSTSDFCFSDSSFLWKKTFSLNLANMAMFTTFLHQWVGWHLASLYSRLLPTLAKVEHQKKYMSRKGPVVIRGFRLRGGLKVRCVKIGWVKC